MMDNEELGSLVEQLIQVELQGKGGKRLKFRALVVIKK